MNLSKKKKMYTNKKNNLYNLKSLKNKKNIVKKSALRKKMVGGGKGKEKGKGKKKLAKNIVTLDRSDGKKLGFDLTKNPVSGRGAVIKNVEKDGQAEATGISVGQVITHFNGTDVTEMTMTEIEAIIKSSTKLTLTLAEEPPAPAASSSNVLYSALRSSKSVTMDVSTENPHGITLAEHKDNEELVVIDVDTTIFEDNKPRGSVITQINDKNVNEMTANDVDEAFNAERELKLTFISPKILTPADDQKLTNYEFNVNGNQIYEIELVELAKTKKINESLTITHDINFNNQKNIPENSEIILIDDVNITHMNKENLKTFLSHTLQNKQKIILKISLYVTYTAVSTAPSPKTGPAAQEAKTKLAAATAATAAATAAAAAATAADAKAVTAAATAAKAVAEAADAQRREDSAALAAKMAKDNAKETARLKDVADKAAAGAADAKAATAAATAATAAATAATAEAKAIEAEKVATAAAEKANKVKEKAAADLKAADLEAADLKAAKKAAEAASAQAAAEAASAQAAAEEAAKAAAPAPSAAAAEKKLAADATAADLASASDSDGTVTLDTSDGKRLGLFMTANQDKGWFVDKVEPGGQADGKISVGQLITHINDSHFSDISDDITKMTIDDTSKIIKSSTTVKFTLDPLSSLYFHGRIKKAAAESLLEADGGLNVSGKFLIRYKGASTTEFHLSIVNKGVPKHYSLTRDGERGEFILSKQPTGANSLSALIEMYRKKKHLGIPLLTKGVPKGDDNIFKSAAAPATNPNPNGNGNGNGNGTPSPQLPTAKVEAAIGIVINYNSEDPNEILKLIKEIIDEQYKSLTTGTVVNPQNVNETDEAKLKRKEE